MEWLPFDLHPEYPEEGIPRSDLIARYGADYTERMERAFAAAGLPYNPPPEIVPNTRRALRLCELARDRDLHQRLHDRLMTAYWDEAQNIGDPDVLRLLAAEVGLDADEVEGVLGGEAYADRIERSTHEAHAVGVTGVPGFLLDRKLLVLGAQPRELFEQAFEHLATMEGPSG